MQFMQSSIYRGAGILLQQLRRPSINTTHIYRNNNVARPLFVGGLYAFKQQQSDDVRRFPSIVSACAATLFAAATTYNNNNNNNKSAICAPALSSLTIKNSRSITNNTTTNNISETSNRRTKYKTNDNNKEDSIIARKAYKAAWARNKYRQKKEEEYREQEYRAELIRRLGYNYRAVQQIKGTPHTKQYKSPPNKPIRSFKIDNVFEIDPELIPPCLRIMDELVLSPMRSINGMVLSMDAKKGNEARVNVNFPSAMVHYYGKDKEGGKLINDPTGKGVYKERAAYATGHGSGTKGICKTQLKNRLFNEDMEFVSTRLRRIIFERHPWLLDDDTVNTRVPTNHMTSLVYANKYQDMKSKEQMPPHTDIAYELRHREDKNGDKIGRRKVWLPCKNNSQKVGTPTINLSMFDSRSFKILEQLPGNVDRQPASLPSVEWLLGNGTLTFIHPYDEKPKYNTKNYLTQYKHGKISYGGDNRLSVCLGFRTTVATLICHESTGSVYVTDDDREKYAERDADLENVENLGMTKRGHPKGCNVKQVEGKLQRFYKAARSRWFKTKS